jgi:hypothetical protein
MKTIVVLIIVVLTLLICYLQAQTLEQKARAQFEAEGAGNMSKADLIILVHDYKASLDWELKRGVDAKARVAQLEVVVQNMTNELLAIYWHRDMLRVMHEDEAKLTAEINRLKGEVNELQRKSDDLRRSKLGRVTL